MMQWLSAHPVVVGLALTAAANLLAKLPLVEQNVKNPFLRGALDVLGELGPDLVGAAKAAMGKK